MAALVSRGEAAIAGIVKLEVLRGAHGHEYERLKRYLSVLTLLLTSEAHYEEAGRLGADLRKRGETIPSSDLLIAALAISHGVALLHCDAHFDRIADLADLRIYPCRGAVAYRACLHFHCLSIQSALSSCPQHFGLRPVA